MTLVFGSSIELPEITARCLSKRYARALACSLPGAGKQNGENLATVRNIARQFFPGALLFSMAEAMMLTELAPGALPGRLSGAFQLDCAREEDVVFQMDVLVQIGFKLLQSLIKRPEADAGVRRRGVTVSDAPHLAEQLARRIVLKHHHPHRILHADEERRRHGTLFADGILHARNRGYTD